MSLIDGYEVRLQYCWETLRKVVLLKQRNQRTI